MQRLLISLLAMVLVASLGGCVSVDLEDDKDSHVEPTPAEELPPDTVLAMAEHH